MPDPPEAVTAAVECILPAGPGIPSGLEAGADHHVAASLDHIVPGAAAALAALLDAAASEAGAPAGLASLDVEARSPILRRLLTDPVAEVRELAGALLVFGLGAVYSEWAGFDRASHTLRRPAAWDTIGYAGPSDAHPEYRRA